MLEYSFPLIYDYAFVRENTVRENAFSGVFYAVLLYKIFASMPHLKF